MGKNNITQGQANSTGMPPDQKVNKAEELTCLYKHANAAQDSQGSPFCCCQHFHSNFCNKHYRGSVSNLRQDGP
jgi:hypothetical protein